MGRDQERIGGIEPNYLGDLGAHPLGLGRGEIDLVQRDHDLMVDLDRLIDVGQGLRFDPLAGVDHQERALAGGEAAVDLVGEIDVARGVHEIELVGPAVARGVGKANRLSLDGDAALALELHRIEELVAHLARTHAAAALDQPVGQGRLPMVDMGDDREVADVALLAHVGDDGSTGGLRCSAGGYPATVVMRRARRSTGRGDRPEPTKREEQA